MDRKDEYREKWQAQIDQLSAKIDELRERAAGATAEAREEIKEHLGDLEGQREKARARFKEMMEAGEEVWDELSEEAEDLFGKLRTGFDRIVSRFGAEDTDPDESTDAKKEGESA